MREGGTGEQPATSNHFWKQRGDLDYKNGVCEQKALSRGQPLTAGKLYTTARALEESFTEEGVEQGGRGSAFTFKKKKKRSISAWLWATIAPSMCTEGLALLQREEQVRTIRHEVSGEESSARGNPIESTFAGECPGSSQEGDRMQIGTNCHLSPNLIQREEYK